MNRRVDVTQRHGIPQSLGSSRSGENLGGTDLVGLRYWKPLFADFHRITARINPITANQTLRRCTEGLSDVNTCHRNTTQLRVDCVGAKAKIFSQV